MAVLRRVIGMLFVSACGCVTMGLGAAIGLGPAVTWTYLVGVAVGIIILRRHDSRE